MSYTQNRLQAIKLYLCMLGMYRIERWKTVFSNTRGSKKIMNKNIEVIKHE